MALIKLNLQKNKEAQVLGEKSIKSLAGAGGGILVELADILDDNLEEIDGDLVNRSNISLPSPWASFLTFNTMFFSDDDNVAANKRAKDEWKSIMLLVALKPFLDLDITFTDVDLKSNLLGGDAKKFAVNVASIMPHSSIFANDAWSKIRLIKLNNHIIGAFSNTSLICSAPNNISNAVVDYLQTRSFSRSMEMVPGTRFAKFNYKNLLNELFDGKAVKCHYILNWIDSFVSKLRTYSSRVDSQDVPGVTLTQREKGYITKLIQRFGELQTDISSNLARWNVDSKLGSFSDDTGKKLVNISASGFSDFKYKSVQDYFDDIEITFDCTVDSVFNQVKIKDMDVISFKNLDADLIRMMKDPSVKKETNGLSAINDDEIFLNKIMVIKANDINMSAHYAAPYAEDENGIKSCPIAPIKQSAMNQYFKNNPYELKDAITYRGTPDDSVVKVEIILENKIGEKVKIEHTYDSNNIILVSPAWLPLMGIWPYADIIDVQTNTKLWKKYYVYTSISDSCRRYTFETNIEARKKNELNKAKLPKVDNRRRYINTYNELPKYFNIYDSVVNNEERGILLLNPPEIIEPNNEKGASSVGLDFGTTSTTAFCRVGDDIDFVKFGNFFEYGEGNALEIVDDSAGSALEMVTLNNILGDKVTSDYGVFFSSDKFYNRMAYPSIFIDSANLSNDPENTLFSKGSAVLKYNFNNIPLGNAEIDDKMKWAKGGVEGKKGIHMQGYLCQILTSIVYYILTSKLINGKIELKLSYPTALPDSALSAYKGSINNVVNYINNNIVAESTQILPVKEENYMTESVAAAANFAGNQGIHFYSCVDIGGGSTDISAWYSDPGSKLKNLMQSSVNIASRTIFRPAFAEYILTSSLDEKEFSDLQKRMVEYTGSYFTNTLVEAKRMYKRDKKAAIEKVAMEVEAVLFEHSEQLAGYVVSNTNKFKRKILFGLFSMLVFNLYSIIYAKETVEKAADELGGNSDLNIFLAGNGSKLYNWLLDGEVKRISKALTEIAMGSGLINDSYKVIINDPDMKTLKTEAAKGLISNSIADNIHNEIVYNGAVLKFRRMDYEYDTIGVNYDLNSNENIVNLFKNDKNSTSAYNGVRLDKNQMNDIKRLVNIYNKDVANDSTKIDADDRFWSEVGQFAEGILKEDIGNGQLSSALMIYVKAVIENI